MSPYRKKIIKNLEARVGSYTILVLLIASMFSIVMVVTNVPRVSALENFTTYFTSNAGVWTITATNVSGNVPNTDAAFIYRDMGSANITDFNISFTWGVKSSTSGAPNPGGFAISNFNSTWIDAYDYYYSTIFLQHRSDTGADELRLMDTSTHNGTGHNKDSIILAEPFRKYIQISRTGTTCRCWIYNDAGHTSLLHELHITCNANASRYVYAHQPYDHPSSSATQDSYIENMIISKYSTGTPPTLLLTSENPSNISTGINLQPQCHVHIENNQGGAMNVTFATNASGVWTNIQSNASKTNNTDVFWTFTSANTLSTRYYWKAYCQAGTTNTSETYYFTTLTSAGIYTIAGLTADEFTWSLPPGGIGWANDTTDGTGGETMNITATPSAGYTCTAIYIDFTDFTSEIMQENMSIEVKNSSSGAWDKTVYQVPSSDGNVTLDASVWTATAWTHGNQIFPINASQTKNILIRIRITYPTTATTGDKVNAGAWRVTWKLES